MHIETYTRLHIDTSTPTGGFTLTELVVVTALLIVLGGGLLTTFLTGQASFVSSEAYIQVQQEARKALDNMVRELREAGPTTGGTPIIVSDSATGPGPNDQLNFQIAREYNDAVECPNAICWGSEDATGEWVHYALITNTTLPGNNNVQLVRCITGPGTWQAAVPANGVGCRVLANNVSATTFTVTSGVVTVSLSFQYTNPRIPGGSQQLTPLTTQVRLRNP